MPMLHGPDPDSGVLIPMCPLDFTKIYIYIYRRIEPGRLKEQKTRIPKNSSLFYSGPFKIDLIIMPCWFWWGGWFVGVFCLFEFRKTFYSSRHSWLHLNIRVRGLFHFPTSLHLSVSQELRILRKQACFPEPEGLETRLTPFPGRTSWNWSKRPPFPFLQNLLRKPQVLP